MIHPELRLHLRSLIRAVYYVTEEEDRAITQITSLLLPTEKNSQDGGRLKVKAASAGKIGKKPAEVFVYNQAFGLVKVEQLFHNWTTRALGGPNSNTDPVSAFDKIYQEDPRDRKQFYIITDPERWLTDPGLVRRFLNIFHQTRHDIRAVKCVIFVGSRLVLPTKLQPYVHVVRDNKVSDEEIMETLNDMAGQIKGLSAPSEDCASWFRGLTVAEIESAVSQSLILTKKETNSKRIDPVLISNYKQERIKKTELLELIDCKDTTFEKVGGLDKFKTWVEETKPAWTKEGRDFGLKPPKGVLCAGVWGCGKSLSVKALGAAWQLPVIRLELGKLRSSAVGATEENVYKATSFLESMAPCVTGETQVTLANGSRVSIENLWYQSKQGDTLEVQCWDEKSLTMTTTPVEFITRREAEAFSISASHGFYLNATGNHQHYVMRGGMPEWVTTDSLVPGDMLAVPIKEYDGSSDCTQFHPSGIREFTREDGITELRRGNGGWTDSVLTKLPVQWSTDLGWLLGAIQGDGHIGVRGAIGMTNTAQTILDKFEQCLSDLLGLKAKRYDCTSRDSVALEGLSDNPEFKTCYLSVVSSKLGAEFLSNAREQILSAPPQVRAAFLAGWIDTDGCIGPSKVTLIVKGPKNQQAYRTLARDLVQSLGVVPSKFDNRNFEVTGSRALALASKITEFLVEKQAKASRVVSSDIGFDRDSGFNCGALLKEIRKASGKTYRETGIPTGTNWSQEQGRVLISERYMKTYLESYGEAATPLTRLLEADCRWVRVQNIEPLGNQVVYDLCCEGKNTHSFIANGIVTHNCVAWVDEAEKSFAGSHSSSYSDAGTTSRTLGILSTWHQETKAEVCLAMTVNTLHTLPVEFINRIEDRFFFDIPSEDVRIDILKIHLANEVNFTPEEIKAFPLKELASAADNLVPREMEQAIRAANRRSFTAGKKRLDAEILKNELTTRPRILNTMDQELKAVLDWVGYDPVVEEGIRARFASSKKSNNTMRILKGGKP